MVRSFDLHVSPRSIYTILHLGGNRMNSGHIGMSPVLLFGIFDPTRSELHIRFFSAWVYNTMPTIPLPARMPLPRNLHPKAPLEIRIGIDQSYNRHSSGPDRDWLHLEPVDLNTDGSSTIFEDGFSDLGLHRLTTLCRY